MSNEEQLSAMLDALINDKGEEAQIAFHSYLGDKMKAEIHGGAGDEATPAADDKTED